MRSVLISSPHPIPWYRQFPDGVPEWGGWRFFFNDAGPGSYDYLVAFDDLHGPILPKCPLENTIHIATEPITVHRYNKHFTDQFGFCLSLDPNIKHPNTIASQPGLSWFIGWNPSKGSAPGAMSFPEIQMLFDEPRTKLVSIVTSNKMLTPGHVQRLNFAKSLKEHFGARLDFYGRGFTPLEDKLDALRKYRFHIALENSSLRHYFSEKLCDSILTGAFPFYWGCPNLEEYLPARSFRRLDINDLSASITTIETSIEDHIDVVNRDALRGARNLIMQEHNLFALLNRILTSHASGEYGHTHPVARHCPTLLPFRHPEFKMRFGPRKQQSTRQFLLRIADRLPPLRILRNAYKSLNLWARE